MDNREAFSLREELFAEVDFAPAIGADFTTQIDAVFSLVKKWLFSKHGLDYDAMVEESSKARSCGHIFEKGELVFHCRNCAVDETCVLCSECFDKKYHEGHSYKYYPSGGEGGSCDCGERESWRDHRICDRHVEDVESAIPNAMKDGSLMDAFGASLRVMLDLMHHLLQRACHPAVDGDESPIDAETKVIVLVNDEVHSFDEVNDMLRELIGASEATAADIAKIVDKRGFAPIKYYVEGAAGLDLFFRRLERIDLEHVRMEIGSLQTQIAVHCLLLALQQIAQDVPDLRSLILNATICEHGEFSKLCFRRDNHLWKEFRQAYQKLLTLGLAFTNVKMQLLVLYEECTEVLAQQLSRDTELGSLSILHFAVQILTVPSVARRACSSGFPSRLCGIIEQLFSSDSCIEHFEAIVLVTRMIRYVANDESVKRDRLLTQNPSFLTCLIKALLPLHERFLKVRRARDHVPYESYSFRDELSITLTVVGWIMEFVDSYGPIVDGAAIAPQGPPHPNVDHLQAAIQATFSFAAEHLQVPADPGHLQRFHFQQPIIWLLGLLLRRWSLLTREPLPVSIPVEVVDYVSRILYILCDMKSGKWIRNGYEVSSQLYFAFSGPVTGTVPFLYQVIYSFLSNQSRCDRPEYATVVGRLLGGDGAIDYADEVFPVRFATFVRILAGSECHGLSTTAFAIVQALAVGPNPYSKIKQLVPPFIADSSDFDAELRQYSTVSCSGSTFESTMWHLREDHVWRFNPYFWYYSDADRERAYQFMTERHRYSRFYFGECPQQTHPLYNHELREYFRSQADTLMEIVQGVFLHAANESVQDDAFILVCGLHASNADTKFTASDALPERLDAFVSQTSAAEYQRRDMNAIFEKMFVGLSHSSSPPESDAPTRDQLLKRRSEQRRREAMDRIRADQESFSEQHGQEMDVEREARQPDPLNEIFSVAYGTCIYCQELALAQNEPFGVLGYFENIKFAKDESPQSDMKTAISCSHVMHYKCYRRMRGSLNVCPLCNAPTAALLPVPQRPLNEEFSREEIEAAIDTASGLDASKIPQEIRHFEFPDAPPPYVFDEENRTQFQLLVGGGRTNMFSLLERNCRQEVALLSLGEPCRELYDIERVGKLMVSYLLAMDGECLARQYAKFSHASSDSTVAMSDPVLPYFIAVLRTRYLPHQKTPERLVQIIHLYRAVILSHVRHDAPDLSQDERLVSLAAILKVLLFNWYCCGSSKWMTPYQLLGTDGDGVASPELVQKYAPWRGLFNVAAFLPNDTSLTPLPRDLSEFFANSILPLYCDRCQINKERTPWLVCLFCGTPCCPSRYCPNSSRIHVSRCHYYQGMFLMPSRCMVILSCTGLPPKKAPAPFVDSHGETDMGFRNGGPLMLSRDRMGYLSRLWISGSLRAFINQDRLDNRMPLPLEIFEE